MNLTYLAVILSLFFTVSNYCFFFDEVPTPASKKLIMAATIGNTAQVQEHIKAHTDIHMGNEEALRQAVIKGHPEIIRLLCNAGAKILEDMVLQTVTREDIPVLILLLEKDASHANSNLLRTAAFNKSFEAINQLIAHGASVQQAYNGFEATTKVYYTACSILKYLANKEQHVKEVCTKLKAGEFPRICNPDIIKPYSWLSWAIAPVSDHTFCSHETDLMIICALGHNDAIDAILACSVPQEYLHKKDSKNYTAAMYAAHYNRETALFKLFNYEYIRVDKGFDKGAIKHIYSEAAGKATEYQFVDLTSKIMNLLSQIK